MAAVPLNSTPRRTQVAGVLNVTPDSFSDGGRYTNPEQVAQAGVEMCRQGASWLDIGGESTRPGSTPVSSDEEIERVVPVLRALTRSLSAEGFSPTISIDTYKSETAAAALKEGPTPSMTSQAEA